MITIHATQKLYAKLPLDADGGLAGQPGFPTPSPAITPNPLDGWHAKLITLQRHNCVLLVHDATRFPLFIKALLKPHFAQFDALFADALMNTLLKLGANERQMDAAASLLAPCRFDTQCSRSVQGTLNRMAEAILYQLWYDNARLEDLSAYRTGVWLADRPCTVKGVKGYLLPQKAMLEMLSRHALQAGQDDTVRSDNVIRLADHVGKRNTKE